MASANNQAKASFFKSHILPVFFVFLIPGFSAWFFSYAEAWLDRSILKQVETEVRSLRNIDEAEKTRILSFYREVPVSRIMASNSPEAAEMQATFASVKNRYATFRWMKRIAWICLATILATFVIVGVSVAFSFRSQKAQYYSLRIGWPILRTSAAIQVLGQAVLAVALSFWVTAILTETYSVKLIAIIGFLALFAVLALLKAIFTKINDRYEVAGELILEADAPTLWQRVRDMAARLQTAAPDRIIAGIDPSFFVTEHPVILGSQRYEGRTLYISLPMLKIMAMEEADAVLGHELAHFSGQDTLWSRKISPLTGKFAIYLQVLGSGLSLVVAHFILLFWKLYGLSIHRLSREREFRADRVGAELISADAMKRALVKVTCYCEYRAETEQAILDKQRVDPELNLALHLERGYSAFLSAFASSNKAIDERVPHPFDTHPTLHNRLEQLGFEADAALRDAQVQQPVENSWYEAIVTAPMLEEQMWRQRQEALQSFHSQDLAWRLLPIGNEETAIVQEYFPHVVFHKKDGSEATLDFDRVMLAEWNAPIFFKDILVAELEDTVFGKRLTLTHKNDGQLKSQKTKFYPGKFVGEKGDFLTLFGHYFSRHKTAQERCRQAVDNKLYPQG